MGHVFYKFEKKEKSVGVIVISTVCTCVVKSLSYVNRKVGLSPKRNPRESNEIVIRHCFPGTV